MSSTVISVQMRTNGKKDSVIYIMIVESGELDNWNTTSILATPVVKQF